VVQKQAAKKHRRHRSRAEADQLAAEYETSGLTREAFCQQRDIALSTLSRHLRRYRREQAGAVRSPRFMQVEVTAPTSPGSPLTVLLSCGHRIAVSRGFDAGTLRQLIAALEED
jgi:hypothetical protein